MSDEQRAASPATGRGISVPSQALLFYGAIVVVNAAIGIGSTALPLGGDQGNYAYAAWAWLEGDVPYRDITVFKPPVTLSFFAVAHLLFEHSMTGIRWVDFGWQLATAVVIAAFTYQWTGRRLASACAAILYALAYYQFGFWHSAQFEGWVVLPLVVALMATSRAASSDDWRPMVVAGVAIAFAAGLKYTLLAGLLPVAALIALQCPWKRWWAMAAGFVAGFVSVVGIIVGWLVQIGAWQAFFDHHRYDLPKYAELTLHGRDLGGLHAMFAHLYNSYALTVLALCVSVGLIGWTYWFALRVLRSSDPDRDAPFRGRDNTFRIVIFAFLAAAVISTFSQGKFFPYQYLPWLGPAAIMAGVVFDNAMGRFPRLVSIAVLGVFVVTISLTTPIAESTTEWIQIATTDRSHEDYWNEEKFVTSNYSVTDTWNLSQWLQEHTEDDDEVFVWGRNPGVNYLAQRRIPTRYIYNYHFRFPWADPAIEQELIEELTQKGPEIVVISSNDATLRASGSPRDSRELLQKYEALRTWIYEHYRTETTIGRFEVLRRHRITGEIAPTSAPD